MEINRTGTGHTNLYIEQFVLDDLNNLPTKVKVKDINGYSRWLYISDMSDMLQVDYNGRYMYRGGVVEVQVGDWTNVEKTLYLNDTEYTPELGQHWVKVTTALPMQEVTANVNNVEIVPTGSDSQGHAYQGLSKVTVALPMQEKSFTVTSSSGTGTEEITADAPYQGLSKVTVNYSITYQPTQLPTVGIVETTVGLATFPSGYQFTGMTGVGVYKDKEELYIPISSGSISVDYGSDPDDNKYGVNDQFMIFCTPSQSNSYKYNRDYFRASVTGSKGNTTFDDLRAMTADEIKRGVCTEMFNYTSETQSSLSDVFSYSAAFYDLKFSGSTNVADWFSSIGLVGTQSSSASYTPKNLTGLKWVHTQQSWNIPQYFMKGIYTLNYFETNAQVIGLGAFGGATVGDVYLSGTLGVAFTPSSSSPQLDPFRGAYVNKFIVPDSMYSAYRTAWSNDNFYLSRLTKYSDTKRLRFVGL